MATFTISNLDRITMRELRARAEMHRRSAAEEAHEILKAVLNSTLENAANPAQDPRKIQNSFGAERAAHDDKGCAAFA